MRDDEMVIDWEEVKKAKERQKNPWIEKYHNKLKELLQSEINSKNNFINWITGLSCGTLLFVFTQNKEKVIVLAGIAFFSSLISAILFKMFLRVNYGPLRIEVKLLRI
ncbi:MAG: hypothetical protein U9N54_06030, partial [candidate division Zixibacteria bacterium]|nr:hypothetical protein [candidate division Zixibacteria bacterium]